MFLSKWAESCWTGNLNLRNSQVIQTDTWSNELGLGVCSSSTFGYDESFTSNKNLERFPWPKNSVRLCLTWGETAYRLVFPESWYDEVPETKDTWNGLKDVLHPWFWRKLGDWKKLNTSISLLYSGFLEFSQIYCQHLHPNEVQQMQLLHPAKHMKTHLNFCIQRPAWNIIPSMVFWIYDSKVPVKPELTNYGMADPRTVWVLGCSKIIDPSPSFVGVCRFGWPEVKPLGLILGLLAVVVGQAGFVEQDLPAFCESKNLIFVYYIYVSILVLSVRRYMKYHEILC